MGAGSAAKSVLVIVLHGDLLQPDNSYHYGFAQTVAAQNSGVVTVGLLRPGYSDERGNRSDGEILNATGDNYSAEVVNAVASGTQQLKEQNVALQKEKTNLEQQAIRDNLTGAYNRHYFVDRLEKETARCVRSQQQVGLIFVDVDKFKSIILIILVTMKKLINSPFVVLDH